MIKALEETFNNGCMMLDIIEDQTKTLNGIRQKVMLAENKLVLTKKLIEITRKKEKRAKNVLETGKTDLKLAKKNIKVSQGIIKHKTVLKLLSGKNLEDLSQEYRKQAGIALGSQPKLSLG